jgi:DNA-binding transcriptional ArsR family regulator
MSYERENPEPTGVFETLAEWTGGLPPEEIPALATVRPLAAVHPLLRGLAGRSPRELVARAAVLEALATLARPSFTAADLDEILSWLAEPARGETLRALRRSGWLATDTAGSWALTAAGRRVWDGLRRAGLLPRGGPLPSMLPAGLSTGQIVRALVTRSLEELAAAGREALVPVLAALPLVTTEAVVQAAETQALHGRPEPGPTGGGQPG